MQDLYQRLRPAQQPHNLPVCLHSRPAVFASVLQQSVLMKAMALRTHRATSLCLLRRASLSLCQCLLLRLCLYLRLCLWVCLRICRCLCLRLCLRIRWSFYLGFCLRLCMRLCLGLGLGLCMRLRLGLCLGLCLRLCLRLGLPPSAAPRLPRQFPAATGGTSAGPCPLGRPSASRRGRRCCRRLPRTGPRHAAPSGPPTASTEGQLAAMAPSVTASAFCTYHARLLWLPWAPLLHPSWPP